MRYREHLECGSAQKRIYCSGTGYNLKNRY